MVIVVVIGVVLVNNVILYMVFKRGGFDGGTRGSNKKHAGSTHAGKTHVVKNPLYAGAKKKDDALAKTLSRKGDDTYDYTSVGAWNAGAQDEGYMAVGDAGTYAGLGVSSTGLSVENPLFANEDNTDMYMSVGQVSDENERMKAEIAAMQSEMSTLQGNQDDPDGMYAMMPQDDTYTGIAEYNEDDELEDAYM
jgi:hypothetical protein